MPLLDVSWVTQVAEFADTFEVVRRGEIVSQFGRTEIRPMTTIASGTIYPTSDNRLVRQEDYTRAAKTYTICTPFRLRMSSPGFQPDIVLYRGNAFIVRNVNDYSQYGEGFVEAEVTSLDAQDVPPQ